jgi:hypothetical protein
MKMSSEHIRTLPSPPDTNGHRKIVTPNGNHG